MHIEDSSIHQYIQKSIRYTLLSIPLVILLLWVSNALFARWIPEFQLLQKSINLWYLSLGWGCMLLSMVALGLRWKYLLPQSKEISTWFVTASVTGGLLINYAIPGPAGEFVCAWLVAKKYNISMTDGITTSTFSRLLGLFVAGLGGVLLWGMVNIPSDTANLVIRMLLIGVGIGVLLLLYIFFYISTHQQHIMHKRTVSPENKLWETLEKIFVSVENTKQLPSTNLYLSLFYSIVGHGIAFLGIHFSILSLGIQCDYIPVLFTYLVGTCCGVLAFLFPGSQLTWDAIFASILSYSGNIDVIDASNTVILLRLEQIAMMLVGGVAMIGIFWQSQKNSPKSNP